MEYMPKGRKGSHKRGKFMDDEADLDGRPNHNHGTKATTNKKGKRKYQLYLEPYAPHPSRGWRQKRNAYMSHPTSDRILMSEEQSSESEYEQEPEPEPEPELE
ncbi:hypothetical protein IFM89_009444, partial [Coptis chinensis]